MKKYFISFTLALAPVSIVLAQTDKEKVAKVFQDQAKNEKISRLIDLLNPNDISSILDDISSVFETALQPKTDITQAPSSEPNPMVEKFKEGMVKLKPILNEIIQESKKDLIPVYSKYFTDEDIDAELSFRNSPTGKRLKTMSLAMVKEMMPIIIKQDTDLDNSAIPEKKRKKLEMLASYFEYKLLTELDTSFKQTNPSTQSALRSSQSKAVPQKSIIDLNSSLNDSPYPRYDPSKMLSKMHDFKVGYYNKNLSDEDLDNTLAFYQSPYGQKSIELMPKILKETTKIFTEKYQPQMMEKIQSLMTGNVTNSD